MTNKNFSINFIGPIIGAPEGIANKSFFINSYCRLNNKRQFSILLDGEFVNSIIRDEIPKSYYFQQMLEVPEGYLFIYKHDKSLNKLYDLFESGRYSDFSNRTKEIIINWNGGPFAKNKNDRIIRTPMNRILNPTEEDKRKLSEYLGVNFLVDQVHTVPDLDNENYNLNIK